MVRLNYGRLPGPPSLRTTLFFPISQNYSSYYHQAPLIPTKNFRWDAKFRLLREFHREHGHCMVSHRHKELGRWVSDQRKKYKKETLNPDKISKLEAVGFVWSGLVYKTESTKGVSEVVDYFFGLCLRIVQMV